MSGAASGCRSSLSPPAQRLLDLLEAEAAAGNATPSQAEIARALDASNGTIATLMKRLLETGALVLIDPPLKGVRPGSYRLALSGRALRHGGARHYIRRRRRAGTEEGQRGGAAGASTPGREDHGRGDGRRDETRVRICLRCKDTFLSWGVGNRLCGACNSWISSCAGEAFDVSAVHDDGRAGRVR